MIGKCSDKQRVKLPLGDNNFVVFREQAPISSSLNAVDLYLVVCIFFVFAALIEYAVILLLLKKRRKPRRTIDEGLMTVFNNANATNAVANVTNGAGEASSSGNNQQQGRDKKVPVNISDTFYKYLCASLLGATNKLQLWTKFLN